MVLLSGSCQPNSRVLFHDKLEPNLKLILTVVCKNQEAVDRVAMFYQKYDLQKTSTDVTIVGTVAQMSDLFQTDFYHCTLNNFKCFCNSCEVEIPDELSDDILAIFGLDSIPMLQPSNLQQQKPKRQSSDRSREITPFGLSQFNPATIASLYNFPAANGQGQKIGIIELGGMFFQSDLNTYFTQNNLPSPAPTVGVVLVDGARQKDDDASVEVALDVDVIAAIVPKATITIYFGKNSMQGFYRTIQVAGQNNDIVSVSWGLDETTSLNYGGYVASFQSLFQSLGKTILVSSGDNGSTGLSGFGAHVSFPASVPGCIACGGTTLNATNSLIVSEAAWSGSGGGYSILYSKPSYQNTAFSGAAGRGVPDISGNADPSTGYIVRYKNQNLIVGGTSAVSPLFSALFARYNQLSGTKIGLANTRLYNLLGTNSYRDVTSGNNGGFTAVNGWDAVTGLGVPHGTNLYAGLNQTTTPSPPTPPLPPTITITSISPASGPINGGTNVTIRGTNLDQVTNIIIGTIGVNTTSKSATQITLITPAQNPGTKTVTLQGATGSNSPTTTFTYTTPVIVFPRASISSVSPASGSRFGNTLVTIRGRNLQNITRISFGSLDANIVSKSSSIVLIRTPRMVGSQIVQAVCSFRDSLSASFTYRYI